MTDLSLLMGLQICVVGLGKEGQALATFLTKRGLPVTATDMKSEQQLGAVVTALSEAGVTLVLGEHPFTLLDKAGIIFVSPGVPLETPFLQEAQARKIPLSTESRLFCHLCPAPIMAITGSSGKTTTTTLLGKIMEASGRPTWVGGNIGRPLIEVVDDIQPDDAVVMELSSFQLEYFHARVNKDVQVDTLPSQNRAQLAVLLDSRSPPIGAILNITPNHLDRHPSMKHYVQAKRAIIDHQSGERCLVMNLDNDMTRTIGNQFGPATHWFSVEARRPGGAGLLGDSLALFDQDNTPQLLAARDEIKLRGIHNLSNILAACLIAKQGGASIEAMRQVITTFTGVDHRLQLVREFNGVTYINDSIATTPERIIAALHAFEEPVVLLAGGRDKRLPWEDAARLIHHKVRHLVLFGEAADLIARAVEHARQDVSAARLNVHRCQNLAEAVTLAVQVAKPGDVVLLSPGCASFDEFSSYVERGHRFEALVNQL